MYVDVKPTCSCLSSAFATLLQQIYILVTLAHLSNMELHYSFTDYPYGFPLFVYLKFLCLFIFFYYVFYVGH